ncbi:hypothetical protein [Wolbachia endosymbiont of Ctenocephalides felis wCfeJ]|uniref:hypothetical protein n=1 Tax=Wolbachia endosymbiont of Ctenocephalides felis wCfeJ TaxID=2732594 RepID=UPI001FE2A040|nr:hypothetical protein [Wolbachia endosymbiont of Ctenocephalides felis wCfeJ]WCR58407.1 MAG: hypothetical protein PG980_000879 [Wolbachia endosymbiont of Ctenocephalides felis wCfeJ]
MINSSGVIVEIFYRYKSEILSHKKILNEVKAYFKRCLSGKCFSYYYDIFQYSSQLESEGIPKLYDIELFNLVGQSISVLNLAQTSILSGVEAKIIRNKRPISACKLFLFSCNNGNYDPIEIVGRSDLSWTKGEKLYHEQVDNKLDKVKIDQMMVEKLWLK